jgi:hypothetical protein
MDFKDIKTWGVLLSITIAIGGGFSKFGSMSSRLDSIESKKTIDIKPLETQIQINNAEIKVLQTQVRQLELENSNPLGR